MAWTPDMAPEIMLEYLPDNNSVRATPAWGAPQVVTQGYEYLPSIFGRA
jgi:hypothetical protein